MNGRGLVQQVLVSVVAAVVASWIIANSPQLQAMLKPAAPGRRCGCGD